MLLRDGIGRQFDRHMIMIRVCLTGVLLFAAVAGATETQRTLLVELRQVPEEMRASSGVEAGPGHYSYDSYDRDRILSVVRDVVRKLLVAEQPPREVLDPREVAQDQGIGRFTTFAHHVHRVQAHAPPGCDRNDATFSGIPQHGSRAHHGSAAPSCGSSPSAA